jgi:chorismate-pyruvate lyase
MPPISPDAMPDRDRQLLVHTRDMTSTLANFYRGDLRVEVLQVSQSHGLYLREVFLRTLAEDRIVEYGVMAVALDQFTTAQQAIIRTGRTPLGALLHQAEIPFKSSPLQYFTSPAAKLASTPLAPYSRGACYGRINQLSKSTGEPLAWIVEILPCP